MTEVYAQTGLVEPQEMRRLTRVKTQSIRHNDCERFSYENIRENGGLIEGSMMVESEPINHVPTMQEENWQGVTNEQIKAIEENKT